MGRNRVICHLYDRVWRCTRASANTGVIESDDPAVHGKFVDQCGVPVVEVPPKVLEQDQR